MLHSQGQVVGVWEQRKWNPTGPFWGLLLSQAFCYCGCFLKSQMTFVKSRTVKKIAFYLQGLRQASVPTLPGDWASWKRFPEDWEEESKCLGQRLSGWHEGFTLRASTTAFYLQIKAPNTLLVPKQLNLLQGAAENEKSKQWHHQRQEPGNNCHVPGHSAQAQ